MNHLFHLTRYIHEEIVEIVGILFEITITHKVVLPRSLAKGKSVEDEYVDEGTDYS